MHFDRMGLGSGAPRYSARVWVAPEESAGNAQHSFGAEDLHPDMYDILAMAEEVTAATHEVAKQEIR